MSSVILAPSGRPARLEIMARYNAARNTPVRTRITSGLRSAMQDIGVFDRTIVCDKSRWLYDNFPLYKALVDRIVIYTVGPGIFPVPVSTDEAFNKSVMASWRRWSRNPDLQTRISWGQAQRIQFTRAIVDGDSFTYQTHGPSGRARIQLIEGPNIQGADKKDKDWDGYSLDEFGRVARWLYRPDLRKADLPITVDPELTVQHYFPHRAQQYRGIALPVASIDTSHDLADTLDLEKQAVKEGSSKTDIIKTAMQGSVTSEESMAADNPFSSIQTDTGFVEYYKQVFGAEAKTMRPGDEFEQFVSNRPSPAWQGFVDMLCELICLGMNLPPSILLQRKVGGSDTRRDAFAASRVFEIFQNELASQWERVYMFWLAYEIDAGFIKNAPADWDSVEWYFPRNITVDSGRDIKSDIELVKMRLMTRQEFFMIYSQTYWKNEMRQSATEVAEKYALSSEFKFPVWEMELLTPNGNPVASTNPQDQPTQP